MNKSEISKVKNEPSKQEKMFAEADIFKLILKMSIPTILMMIGLAMYTIIDTILATHFIGLSEHYGPESSEYAVAISGWTVSITSMAIGVVSVLNIGTEIKYAYYLGKSDYDMASKTIGSAISSSLLIGVLVSAIMMSISSPLIELVIPPPPSGPGVTSNDIFYYDSAVQSAKNYINIQMAMVTFYLFYDLVIRVLRVEGKVVVSSLIGVIGIPINLLLDYIFMGPLEMGMEGAGIATLMAYIFTAATALLIILKYQRRGETKFFTGVKNMKINTSLLVGSFVIGSPFIIRVIMANLNTVFLIESINSLPATDIPPDWSGESSTYWSSTSGIFTQVSLLIYQINGGIIQGSGGILSYNYGKGSHERYRKALKITLLYQIFVLTFFSSILIAITPQLINLFGTKATEPAVNLIRILFVRTIFDGITWTAFYSYSITSHQPIKAYSIILVQNILFYFLVSPWTIVSAQSSYLLCSIIFTISTMTISITLIIWMIFDSKKIAIYSKKQSENRIKSLEVGGSLYVQVNKMNSGLNNIFKTSFPTSYSYENKFKIESYIEKFKNIFYSNNFLNKISPYSFIAFIVIGISIPFGIIAIINSIGISILVSQIYIAIFFILVSLFAAMIVFLIQTVEYKNKNKM